MKKRLLSFINGLFKFEDNILHLQTITGFCLSLLISLYFLAGLKLNLAPHLQISAFALLFLFLLILHCLFEIRITTNLELYMGESKAALEKRQKRMLRKRFLVYGLVSGMSIIFGLKAGFTLVKIILQTGGN